MPSAHRRDSEAIPRKEQRPFGRAQLPGVGSVHVHFVEHHPRGFDALIIGHCPHVHYDVWPTWKCRRSRGDCGLVWLNLANRQTEGMAKPSRCYANNSGSSGGLINRASSKWTTTVQNAVRHHCADERVSPFAGSFNRNPSPIALAASLPILGKPWARSRWSSTNSAPNATRWRTGTIVRAYLRRSGTGTVPGLGRRESGCVRVW